MVELPPLLFLKSITRLSIPKLSITAKLSLRNEIHPENGVSDVPTGSDIALNGKNLLKGMELTKSISTQYCFI